VPRLPKFRSLSSEIVSWDAYQGGTTNFFGDTIYEGTSEIKLRQRIAAAASITAIEIEDEEHHKE